MIEILFGESEGGAMKLAKNYQQPDYEDGPTAWLGEKPDKATFEDMFAGEAVGGTSAEVIILLPALRQRKAAWIFYRHDARLSARFHGYCFRPSL